MMDAAWIGGTTSAISGTDRRPTPEKPPLPTPTRMTAGMANR